MGIAKSMGIAGADTVVDKAQGFAKWAGALPFRGGWALTKAGGRKFDRDVMKSWSPRAILKGWEANAKAKEEAHLGGATGAWRDRVSKILGEGTTHYKDMEEENLKNKELKEMEAYATNDDYLLAEIRSLEGKTDAKSQARTAAAVSMMFRNNDQNEFMKKFGIDGKGGSRDPMATRKALVELFKKTGMNENQVGRNLYQLGEIALSKGNIADYGMGKFKDGKYQISTDSDQKSAATSKFVNMSSQEKMKSMHWNSILTETKDNKVGEVHETGKALLNNITAAEIKQVERSRADFLQKMSDPVGRKSLEDFMNNPAECTNKENVKALLAKIDEQLTKKSKEESGAKEEETFTDGAGM
jgi:hypothetical protein